MTNDYVYIFYSWFIIAYSLCFMIAYFLYFCYCWFWGFFCNCLLLEFLWLLIFLYFHYCWFWGFLRLLAFRVFMIAYLLVFLWLLVFSVFMIVSTFDIFYRMRCVRVLELKYLQFSLLETFKTIESWCPINTMNLWRSLLSVNCLLLNITQWLKVARPASLS